MTVLMAKKGPRRPLKASRAAANGSGPRARIRAADGAPEYPHYTRPAEYRGWSVPEVLLSGHHERIRAWRLEQSRGRREGPGEPLR